jgi:hypothetical protein
MIIYTKAQVIDIVSAFIYERIKINITNVLSETKRFYPVQDLSATLESFKKEVIEYFDAEDVHALFPAVFPDPYQADADANAYPDNN